MNHKTSGTLTQKQDSLGKFMGVLTNSSQIFLNYRTPLRKRSPYSELFWSVFSRIRTEYGAIRSISPYSVQMPENTDQNNSNTDFFYAVYGATIK